MLTFEITSLYYFGNILLKVSPNNEKWDNFKIQLAKLFMYQAITEGERELHQKLRESGEGLNLLTRYLNSLYKIHTGEKFVYVTREEVM